MRNLMFARRLIPAAVLFVNLVPVASFAQAAGTPEEMPRLKQWDATGTIGWYYRRIPSGYGDQPASSMFAGATLGRYWTEHVKTEVEVATGGRSDHHYYWIPEFTAVPYSMGATLAVSDIQASAALFYQFFHNAWFHPFVGAGVVYDNERYSATRQAQQEPVYTLGSSTPKGYVVVPPFSRDWTASHVAPFVLTGFKAYLSQHAFFRADMRIAARGGTHTVNTRIGFGFDF